MQNRAAIGSICTQIIKSCEKIQTVTSAMDMFEQSAEELAEMYGNIQFDELEHVQILTLSLTKLISDAESEHEDDAGSVFAPGDLTAEKKGESKE